MSQWLPKIAVYAVYIVCAVAGICYFAFWRPFVAELGERFPPPDSWDAPRHVSAETLRRLGSIATGRPGNFVHFDADKAPGVVRACALGDSYTYGDEVAPGDDPPHSSRRSLGHVASTR
jgi:hypothetical protein